MKKSILLLLLFALGLTSCHFGWETKARYFTGDYETVAAIAQGKGKPLWMILGGGENCRSCNQLIENMKREDVFRKFEDDYVFYRCNVDEPDNLFLKYIFLMETIPNSYIVSPEGKVCSYASGPLQGKDVVQLLTSARDNYPYFPSRHVHFKSGGKKLLRMQNLLLSVCLRYRHISDDTLQLRALLPDVEEAISIEPYFYNLYLASRIHRQLGDTLTANRYAREALDICPDGFQTLVFRDLIHELENGTFQKDTLQAYARIVFDTTTLNVRDSRSGEYVFRFKNTGTVPLLVKHVSSSCGCATPDWTRHPVLPGEKGEIKVHYQPDRDKAFTKTLWVQTNAINRIEQLTLKGNGEQ